MERIDSTHSTWLFDAERHRFCRLPLGAPSSPVPPDRDWQEYSALELDDATGAFTVVLNEERTKLLRAWRQVPEPTTELELLPEQLD